jgi:hypothetical protein
MRSIWKAPNAGFAMVICSPLLALGFGREAFVPVALTSILGGAVLLVCKSLSTQMFVGRLTAELVQDLVYADKDRRDPVLAGLKKAERDWFLAELPRAKAELRHSKGQISTDCRASARWGWRIRYAWAQ